MTCGKKPSLSFESLSNLMEMTKSSYLTDTNFDEELLRFEKRYVYVLEN
jgi:hypothetical protein